MGRIVTLREVLGLTGGGVGKGSIVWEWWWWWWCVRCVNGRAWEKGVGCGGVEQGALFGRGGRAGGGFNGEHHCRDVKNIETFLD